ncbi:ABC transporter ATP-binding protein [Azospirillum sp.]|uniref:ABC transporter ATP-binding protein n=1 Tax=Azospirillum sp. TaxID=34012 RepID=UPI002D3CE539|nr:ATP-binding cassette domain-containing protein [Azospirillum sp.]HYD68542.1 ATP-binding cassette domain-containing protein [Azospirillum sp.]
MIALHAVDAFIEGVQVLRRTDLALPPRSTVALIGRNGAGKTTLLRTVMGFVPVSSGRVTFDGRDITGLEPHLRPPLGIGYAPEDRRLFPTFTIEENILLPGQVCGFPPARLRERLELIYEVAPELKAMRQRKAASLSGGQGKMVALGRALMIGTRLVLLDEPFQGLAPALALKYAEALRALRDREREVTLLITESNPSLLRSFAETVYLIERGEVSRTDALSAAH